MAITPLVTSGGIASGLDVNGIVSKLMALEQQPLTTLANKEADYNAKLTAYGSIKGALSNLQTAAKALAATGTFTGNTASVSDTSVLAASASSTAAAGTYNLSVTQLATAHTVRSTTNYAAITDTFNTGTLAISINGGTAVNVTIDSSNNTLAGIRQAINNANAGVTATIVNDGTTNRLLLSSKTSGSTGAIAVTAVDSGSGGTHALSDLDSASLFQTQAASDAQVTINGLTITRSSNTITDAIEGVTLNLSKGTVASPGNAILAVTRDTGTTTVAINSFVTAYNTAMGLLKADTAYDAANKKAAVLNGDNTARSLQSDLASLLWTSVTGVAGGISTLSDIGISRQADGTLATDSTRLAAALADPTKDVSALFSQTTSGNQGIAVRFKTLLQSAVEFGGLISARTDGITNSIKSLGTTRDALNLRLARIETQYRSQFTALDSLIVNMQKTSQYLTQAFSSMTANNK